MKILDVVQGSAEWLKARCGIPTASRFCDIITPAGKPKTGETPRKYMLELCGERLTGTSAGHFVNAAMERGTMLESAARNWYEAFTGKTVVQVGFILADGGRWGASPDGITDVGGIEIKCPLRVAMLDMLERHEPSDDYMLQIQANMWICNRKTWDFVLYTDEQGIPSATWTIERNDALCDKFAEVITSFCDRLDELTEKMEAMR